ncbi:MAG TPA: glycosyltransferase family 1 protein [Acidimicrobiales bacterium]|nr:glycosyltransferase family 1 protein [Acidimicrobiales bacterium]
MADRLRLSLDVTAVPANPVGAGQYTVQLARALSHRPDVDLLVVARSRDGSRWTALVPNRELVTAAPEPRPLRLAWEQVRLPSLLKRRAVDVHHGPHYTMPEHAKVPVVVTVHDLSFFEEPQWHERSKVVLFQRAIKVAARRARVVVCPSLATADELVRWCQVDAEVVVAHHGVDLDRFRPVEPAPGTDAARLAALATGSGSTGRGGPLAGGAPFLVFVGTLEPRKDVPTLVRAFGQIASRHPEARLVLAGGTGWGATKVEAAVARSGVGDRIIRTGYVADEVVPALFRSAVAVVYPALYEGFGLPALEAMACGAQVVTTSGSAMEEVAGDAAILVPPGDTVALSGALESVLSGSGPDPDRRQRGLDIAARHTWAASADRHMEAYRRAAGREPGGHGLSADPVG